MKLSVRGPYARIREQQTYPTRCNGLKRSVCCRRGRCERCIRCRDQGGCCGDLSLNASNEYTEGRDHGYLHRCQIFRLIRKCLYEECSGAYYSIYDIYTPKLRLGAAVFVWERQHGCIGETRHGAAENSLYRSPASERLSNNH